MTPVFTRAQGLDLAPQRPVGVAHRLHSRVMAPARPPAGGRGSVSARGRGVGWDSVVAQDRKS